MSSMILAKEKEFINKLCDQYHYDDKIRCLLYIIIPAFIIKYGMNREKLILNVFQDIQVMNSEKEDKSEKVYYSSTLKEVMGEYTTRKYMVIQNYQDISLVDLLVNLIYEFNRAINSSVNEIKIMKQNIYLRTGITYRLYQKDNLQFVKKQSSYILEGIINMKQTMDVIDIIKRMNFNNPELARIANRLNSISSYSFFCESYSLQNYLCRNLLNQSGFVLPIEEFRINGEIYDIEKWFDDITKERDSYKNLNESLDKIYELKKKYAFQKFFRSITANKIKDYSRKVIKIVEKFQANVKNH